MAQRADPAFLDKTQHENDLAALSGILFRRKMTIFLSLAACVLAALTYIYTAAPQYVATTEIMIHTDGEKIPESTQTLMSPSKAGAMHIRSQAEIMKSPDIIRRTLAVLPLYEHKEFVGQPMKGDFQTFPPAVQDYVIRAISRHLNVKPVIGTAIIAVQFRSQDPVLAAQAANQIVQSYIDRRQDKNKSVNADLTAFVNARADALLEDLRQAEEALRHAHQLGGISAAQSDLQAKQAERLKDDYTRLQQQLLEIETVPTDDKILSDYKIREAALKQEKAELAKRYGVKHPAMVAVQAQLNEAANAVLLREAELIRQRQQRAEDMRATMVLMQKKMHELDTEIFNNADHDLNIRRLEAEVEAARALYNRFVLSRKEISETPPLQDGATDILYAAIPPAFPAYPQKILMIALSMVTGLFIGVFLALVSESLRKGFYTAEQLEKQTGLPVYATLPKIKSLRENQTVGRFVTTRPADDFSEQIRTLLATLRLTQPRQGGGQVINITSTTTGEGKTSLASAIANTAAQSGLKVLIIDANMRRPALHKHYDIGHARGLSDYLSDRLPIDDVIYTKHSLNIHIMTTKPVPTHALTLLNSDRTEALLRRMRERYDMTIIDTPSARHFTDARLTAQWSDLTLYVVESAKITHEEVSGVLKSFWNARLTDIALVLNKAGSSARKRDKSLENAYLKDINNADEKMAA